AAVAVGLIRRADQLRLLAHLHLAHTLRPAGDHAAQRELGWLTALDGTVEHGAVGELALVVDLDGILRRWDRTGAGSDRLVDDARRQDLGPGLLGRLIEVLLALRLLGGG